MTNSDTFYNGLLGPKLNNSFTLNSELVDEYRNKQSPFGFNGLGEVVYLRTYAREKEDGTCEVWADTVERVVNGVFEILQHHIVNKLHKTWDIQKAKNMSEDMFVRIFNMKFMPPGRGLWAMGSPIITKKGFAASLNNCAFISTDNLNEDRIYPFTFLMDASMLGVGVGFDTKGANSFVIPGPNYNLHILYIISDNREGWVESVSLLLNSYFTNNAVIDFDYSNIRESGSKLKTFGGVSSGPKPLQILHNTIRKLLDLEIGKLISVTCITDIMNIIGVCVVSGNIRRCLPKDSLVHTKHGLVPIQDIKIGDLVQTSTGYNTVTDVMFQGTQYLINIITQAGEFRCTPNHRMAVRGNKENEILWVQAKDLHNGHKLIINRIPIDGQVTCLPNCNTLIIPELDDDMAWLIGLFILRGNILQYKSSISIIFSDEMYNLAVKAQKQFQRFGHNLFIELDKYASRNNNCFYSIRCTSYELMNYFDQYIKTAVFIPEFIKTGTLSIRLNFIKGMQIDEYIEYYSKPEILQIQTLCYSCGLETELTKYNLHIINNSTNNLVSVVKLEYQNEEKTYDITVDTHEFYCNGYLTHNSAEIAFGQADCKEFLNLKSYEINPQRQEHGWASNNSIFANIGMDYNEVCDHVRNNGEPGFAWLSNMQSFSRMGGDPDNKDIKVSGGNPCLEQSLESNELCCLVETFPNRHDTIEDFKQTLILAFLFAKTVTLLPLHWPKSNEIMQRNRRIGCSVSGIAQFITSHGLNNLKIWLETGYDTLKEVDTDISEWLCINKSIKMTSVKPSGTVSLLAGATPGIHYPESNYYIRRIRIGNDSYLLDRLIKAGYHVEECSMSKNTMVVEFPVHTGDNIRNTRDVSMWEQLSLAAFMQRWWSDNQVSATITFDPAEGKHIANALNYFQYQLKGISFLPRLTDDTIYKQIPYEAITKEQYDIMYSKINKNVSLSTGAISTATDETHHTYCDNDKCIKI